MVYFATILQCEKDSQACLKQLLMPLLETRRQEIKGQSDPSNPTADAQAQVHRSLEDDAENRVAAMNSQALADVIATGAVVETVAKKASTLPSDDTQMLKLMQGLMDQLKSM